MTRLSPAVLLLAAGCHIIDAGAGPSDGDRDPLDVEARASPGSLDDLYRTVLQPTCAAQPGACHAGQFEPNLSTPGLAYANLVARPSLELEDRLRVRPGDPDRSLIIDKLRKRNGVATRMPLGAEPLPEEVIHRLETWIREGALRAPGAALAPALNNPPEPPEIGVFDGPGPLARRLDGPGRVAVAPGDTLVFRHSAHDFETPADAVAYSGFSLYTPDGRVLSISPGSSTPTFVASSFEAAAPQGQRHALSYQYPWTVPERVKVRTEYGSAEEVETRGLVLTLLASFTDGTTEDAMSTSSRITDLIEVR